MGASLLLAELLSKPPDGAAAHNDPWAKQASIRLLFTYFHLKRAEVSRTWKGALRVLHCLAEGKGAPTLAR